MFRIKNKPLKIIVVIFSILLIMVCIYHLINVIADIFLDAREPEDKIGDTVYLGRYKYKEDEKRDDVRWIVLDTVDNKLLLVSEDIIDCIPYKAVDENSDLSWKNLYIREWLNSDFKSAVLANIEDEMHPINPKHLPKSFFDIFKKDETKDYVFLMNVKLAESFDREMLKAKPSEYAANVGVETSNEGYGKWWLLPPDGKDGMCAYVDENGDIQYIKAEDVDLENCNIGIRPMIILKFYATGRFRVYP